MGLSHGFKFHTPWVCRERIYAFLAVIEHNLNLELTNLMIEEPLALGQIILIAYPLFFTDLPNATRNIQLFPSAWGEKNRTTSSS